MKNIFLLLLIIPLFSKAQNNYVDVLVLYPKSVSSIYANNTATQIEHFINYGNETFEKSNISLRLKLLDSVEVQDIVFSNAQCKQQTLNSMETSSEVTDLRRLYRPHLTVMLCSNPTDSIIGTGHFPGNGFFKSGLATAIHYDVNTFIHEIGHNLGVGHGKRASGNDDKGFPIPTSMGYGVPDNYRDVMTRNDVFGNAVQYNFLSNKAITSCIGSTNTTCGTSAYNAAPAIETVYANTVSTYKSSWVDAPSFHRHFLLTLSSSFTQKQILTMYSPYYKEICETKPGEFVACQLRVVQPGQYRFFLGNNVNWKKGCTRIEGNYCIVDVNNSSNGSIAIDADIKTRKTTINISNSYNGPGKIEVRDQTNSKSCIIGGLPKINCTLVYEDAVDAPYRKINLKLVPLNGFSIYGWSSGCDNIFGTDGELCEITLNGSTKNTSAWVDYD